MNAVAKPVEVWLELGFLELEYFVLAKWDWTQGMCLQCMYIKQSDKLPSYLKIVSSVKIYLKHFF